VLGIEEISSSSKLIQHYDEMIREEDEIKSRLKQAIPNIKQMSYKAVEYLRELA
jgi:colanic acid/amylovoran biosynthesis protein